MEKNIVMEDKKIITPEEIANVEFGKGLRGYKEDDVDDFLEKLIETVEYLEKKIKSQGAIIENQQKEIKKYESMRETLTVTLLKAEANAEETCRLAEKKADEIIEEAKAERNEMLDAAEKKVNCMEAKYEEIKNKCITFKNNYLGMLNAEIQDINSYTFEKDDTSNITEEQD